MDRFTNPCNYPPTNLPTPGAAWYDANTSTFCNVAGANTIAGVWGEIAAVLIVATVVIVVAFYAVKAILAIRTAFGPVRA